MHLHALRSSLPIILWAIFYGHTSTLSQLTQLMFEAHPSIQASELQVRELSIRGDTQGYLPNPKVGYTYFGESVQTRTGPQEHVFSIQQSIPWINKLSQATRISQQQAQIGKVHLEIQKADLVLELRLAWADLKHLQHELIVQDSIYKIMKQREALLQKQFEFGSQNYSDLLTVQNEVLLQLEVLKEMQKKELQSQWTIRNLIGDSVKVVTDHELKHLSHAWGDREFQWELGRSPYAQSEEESAKSWGMKAQQSEFGYLPEINLGMTYISTGTRLGVQGNDPWALNVGLTLPIYVKKTGAEVQAAKLAQQRHLTQSREIESDLSKEFEQLKIELMNVYSKRLLYEEKILVNLRKSVQWSNSAAVNSNLEIEKLLKLKVQYLKAQSMKHHLLIQEFQIKAKIMWLLGDTQTHFRFPFKKVHS